MSILTDASEVADFLSNINNLALNGFQVLWYQGGEKRPHRPLSGRLNGIGHFLPAFLVDPDARATLGRP